MVRAISHGRSASVSAFVVAFVAWSWGSALADEAITIAESAQEQIALRGGGGTLDDPEDPLKLDELQFVGPQFDAIIPSILASTPEQQAARRQRAKVYLRAVLDSSATVQTYHATGLLHGVELDWFFVDGTTPPTENRLPVAVDIRAPAAGGTTVLVARLYCYDSAQYALRKASIEAAMGHAMDTSVMWLDDVATATGTGGERLQLDGSGNALYGDCASASGVRVQGTGNQIVDGVRHVRPVLIFGANSVSWTDQVQGAVAPALPFTEAAARTTALTVGTYHAGDVTISSANPPNPGIVFAEGSILVSGTGLSGNWTFVSASGTISFGADDLALTPYTLGVAAVAFAGDVEVDGARVNVLGALHAPSGMVHVRADESRIHGIVVGDRIHVTGTNTVVTDGSDPH